MLLTACEMVQSRNVSVVLLDSFCQTIDNGMNDLLHSQLQLENDLYFKTVCLQAHGSIEDVFQDLNTDIFIGEISDYDRNHMTFSELYNRPYITPFGIERHQSDNIFWSMGASVYRIAIALRLVLTHYKWRNVVLITEAHGDSVIVGSEVFIQLAHEGFNPQIVYIRNESAGEDIENVLRDITVEQKGN